MPIRNESFFSINKVQSFEKDNLVPRKYGARNVKNIQHCEKIRKKVEMEDVADERCYSCLGHCTLLHNENTESFIEYQESSFRFNPFQAA